MATNVWEGCGTTNSRAGSCVEIKADVIRYVNKIDTDSGFVQAKHGNDRVTLPLCKYTKVMLLGTKDNRTYFKVMDGTYKGQTLHMSAANATEYLGKTAPQQTPAELVVTYGKYVMGWRSVARDREFDQQLATASIQGISASVTMNSDWSGAYYPIPPGEYLILIPDTPHNGNMTGYYRNTEPSLKHHQVWFPIKYGNNSRYVHVGNVSDGCTTVVDLAKWADIHEALISHRAPDGISVGKLIVKGKPERAR